KKGRFRLLPFHRIAAVAEAAAFLDEVYPNRISTSQISGLLALEEVVSVPDICNALPRLFLYGVKEKTDPFGDFRGRPH
nr:hypothetical protein [Tanacetum cinerariifolium]